MKEIVFLSGKGGTGKTSITAAFAQLAKKSILCDADVDASNLHLLLQPQKLKQHNFSGGRQAVINHQNCTQCGKCLDLCKFGSITQDYNVRSHDCEGCGVCVDLCPENAIDFPEKENGNWFISETDVGPMVHARLGLGEDNSGKLVSLIRREARTLLMEKQYTYLLTDGPPGVGCPAIASLSGADAVVVIAEPTLSGVHDADRTFQLIHHFGSRCLVTVNKSDLNPELSTRIHAMAKRAGIFILPSLSFDPMITEAMLHRQPIITYAPSSNITEQIKMVWEQIIKEIETQKRVGLHIH